MVLIAILIIVLIGLLISYATMVDQRHSLEQAKLKALGKYQAIVRQNEQLLENKSHLPLSPIIVRCIYLTLINTLKSIQQIEPNKKIESEILKNQERLQQHQRNQANDTTTIYSMPTAKNDKEAVNQLRAIKQLRNIIRHAYVRNELDQSHFFTENNQLEKIEIDIHLANILKRVNLAKEKGRLSTAKQLIDKGFILLNKRPILHNHHAQKTLTELSAQIEQELAKTYQI